MSRYFPVPRMRRAQRRIARSNTRFKVVACGRRWGKTVLGMNVALYHALAGKRVWWVAPTYQLAFHPWRALKARLGGTWETKTENEHHIDLESGGSITIKTAQHEWGLRGVGLDYLVLDEAAFIPGEIWRAALRPALSDRGGGGLFISTPHGRNWFYHAYQKGLDPLEPDWRSWHYKTITNPLISADDLAEARRDTPEHLYLQEYEAQFNEDGGQVFRHLQRATIAPTDAVPKPDGHYVMGVDFGRYDDFTACVVIDCQTRMMVDIDRFNLLEWSLQRERIKALANKWKPYWIVAEANAMGEPNIEALQKDGLYVKRFQTTSITKPALIENLVAAIENVDLGILPDHVLIEELAAYTYRTSRVGHTIYEAPAGRHDDTVMALALAWSEAQRPRLALASVAI